MKKLFKIYNRLTDISDHEYKFMVENKPSYINKAQKVLSLLEDQDIDLYRMPDYDNSDEPNTGSGFWLFNKEATVFDRMGVENTITRSNSEDKYENNYGRPDVFVIAKILQELETWN